VLTRAIFPVSVHTCNTPRQCLHVQYSKPVFTRVISPGSIYTFNMPRQCWHVQYSQLVFTCVICPVSVYTCIWNVHCAQLLLARAVCPVSVVMCSVARCCWRAVYPVSVVMFICPGSVDMCSVPAQRVTAGSSNCSFRFSLFVARSVAIPPFPFQFCNGMHNLNVLIIAVRGI